MTEYRTFDTEGREATRRETIDEQARGANDFVLGTDVRGVEYSAALMRDLHRNRRGNSEARARAIKGMQHTHGNRAVQRYVQGSTSSHRTPSLSVQREEGGMWDYAKKLTGADLIGSGIEKIAGKAKSGYNWAEKKMLDLFKPGGKSPAPVPEDAPRSDYSRMIEVMDWSWGVSNPASFEYIPEEQKGAW